MGPDEIVTRFPKIYDKLNDKKVLGILINDPVSQNVTRLPENVT